MQNVIATPTSLDRTADAHPARLLPKDQAWRAGAGASARSRTVALGRHIKARDLHPGDIVQQYDWRLHVRLVLLGPATVAIVVTEFEFQLHYAADAQVELAL